MMLGGAALAAVFLIGTAAPSPAIIGPGYQPQDKDERGLWLEVDEAERQIKTSNFVMRDPGLNTYVRRVFCRTVGEAECSNVRIYLIRTPQFNAQMAPNGMMLVNSGLFLRTRDEAQFAAVLGHEYGHYARRHSLRSFRDLKSKTGALAFLSVVPVASYGAAAVASAAQLTLIGSIFSFSRDMEREADAGSIPLLQRAGYDPAAASRIWDQILRESDATAAARKRGASPARRTGGFYDSHPTSQERLNTLRALSTGMTGTLERDAYRHALAPFWSDLIDDQIKLNDFGATEFLITSAASDGWSAELYYARAELYRARGNPVDLKLAIGFYQQSIAFGDAPAGVWRGLGLAQLRSGDKANGQASLKHYLGARPDAPDRAIIRALAGES